MFSPETYAGFHCSPRRRRTLAAHLSLVWVAKLSGAQEAKATRAACPSKVQEPGGSPQRKRRAVLKCVNNRRVASRDERLLRKNSSRSLWRSPPIDRRSG